LSEDIRIELAGCTNLLLREIVILKLPQKSIAKTYALALRSSEETDWPKVNKAIIERWSLAGLERIKRLAWSGKAFS